MQIPILIEPIEGGRFRARAGEPFVLSVEADSADAAQSQLGQLLAERLRNGTRLVLLDVPPEMPTSQTPTIQTWYGFRDDELYKTNAAYREFREAMAENRRLEDEEEARRQESGAS